ncbi:MAG TPA: IPTL-CTERM sorting domain-containing protein [Thermoanaerobaculia bacterium]|jgi:hypothetical protein|nr:IPTL-CTERM sorting domain-containing protein [Thermoanaerobaculia bacterium]
MNPSSRRLSVPALRLALAFLVSASGAAAATFTVTNLFDAGPGSLRQAVLNANAAAGPDEVAFAPGLSGTITLTSGEIVISDPLIVHGPGIGLLTVSGNDLFRIFYVEKPAVAAPIDVTLSGMTLTRGMGIPEHSGLGREGGAVLANGENLTILDSVISDSTSGVPQDPSPAACGGNVALVNPAEVSGLVLRIVNSLLTGGTTQSVSGTAGGNLCVMAAKLILDRSTLTGGSAQLGSGGGLYGLSLADDSSIVLSTISGNQAGDFGGGIATESSFAGPMGDLTIESSTISGNTAFSGGGISNNETNVRIFDSTISGNQSNDTGGGISNGFLGVGNLEMTNSTVSGNQSRLGGGIFSGPGLLLRLTTVSNNTATLRGGSLLADGPVGTVQVDHSILANGTPQDVDGGAAPLTLTANYSLIEAPGTTIVAGAHNLIGVDPLLGPLANNGGPTLTHRPLPGSPVLDAGNPAIPDPPPTDQRGSARIVGPAVDLGSVEEGLAIIEVPTLSQVGLLILCALLLAAGVHGLRKVGVPRRASR